MSKSLSTLRSKVKVNRVRLSELLAGDAEGQTGGTSCGDWIGGVAAG